MSDDSARVLRERHKSLYFVDGNVALLAPCRDGRSEVVFRVHKSVLSSHSPVFSDMFDVCNAPGSTSEGDADESYDGVPLVRLSDDADHFGSVLEILYCQRDLPYMPRSPDYPGLVGPILELMRKYRIDRMYAQIVQHLKSDWPKKLKDWDKLERDFKNHIDDSDVERIDHCSPEPASAIELARRFDDVYDILPAAFYHLSRLSILDDREKTHADPSMRIRSPTKRTARWELLSAEDFRCLLLGKAELAEYLHERVDTNGLRHTDDDDSDDMFGSSSTCTLGERAWKDIVDRYSLVADPLAFLQTETPSVRGCDTCAKVLRDKLQTARAQIWENLGELFHLKVQ